MCRVCIDQLFGEDAFGAWLSYVVCSAITLIQSVLLKLQVWDVGELVQSSSSFWYCKWTIKLSSIQDLIKYSNTHLLHLQNYESKFDSLQNMNTIFSSSQQKTSMYLNLVSKKYTTYHLHNIMTIANAAMIPPKLKGFSPL